MTAHDESARPPHDPAAGDHPHAGDVRSNEDLTEAAAEGLRWIAYSRVAIELVLLGSIVVLARLIPPAEFGIFAIVVIVQELAVVLPMEGIGSAMVQRRTIVRDHLRGGLMMSIGVGLALAGLTILLAQVVVDPVFGERTATLVMATTPYYLLGAIYAAPAAVLRRRLDFRRLSIVDLTLNASRVVATLALAIIGLDAGALVFGSMIGMAMALALALFFAPVPFPRWRLQAMRDLLPYGGPAALATVAWTGFRNGDYAIIGATLGPAQVGFYWRAYQLAVEYQRKISVAMAQMAFPVLARTAGASELLALRQRMVRLLTVVVFPLLTLLVVLAPVVVPWLFGPAWEPAVLPTQILALGGAAMLATDACGSALMAVGRARALLGFGVAHLVAYVGLVIVLAPLGLVAVSITASVVHTVFLGVAYVVLLGDLVRSPLRVLWQDVAPATTSCLALIAVAVPVALGLSSIDASPLVQIGAVGLAGGLAYLGALRLWFPSSAHDLGAAVGRVLPARLTLPRLRGPALAKS